jgi:hypothetical protein
MFSQALSDERYISVCDIYSALEEGVSQLFIFARYLTTLEITKAI